MKYFLAILPLTAIAILVVWLGSTDSPREAEFHVTLAMSDQYASGVYTESFQAAQGDYSLRFVPNGDSPQTLTILLDGSGVSFNQTYTLKGTLHETGISKYHTWEYEGIHDISVPHDQMLSIVVDPHGNTMGPISVSLVKN